MKRRDEHEGPGSTSRGPFPVKERSRTMAGRLAAPPQSRPIFTRLYRSITSSLVIRMQPEEIACPMYSGWLVPWMR